MMEQTSQALSIFNFQDIPLQTVMIGGELWWVATDVCGVLEIANVSQAVENLDEDEKLLYVLDISGQQRQVWIVNQFGLFALIFRSRKPQAKAFSHWVRHEVLPAIFKTGKYEVPMVQLDMIEQITHLEERIKGLKVRLVDDVDREVISVVVRRMNQSLLEMKPLMVKLKKTLSIAEYVQRPDIIEIKAFFEKVEAQVKQLQNAVEVDAEANEQMLELYGFAGSVLEAVEQNSLTAGKDVKLLKAKKDEW